MGSSDWIALAAVVAGPLTAAVSIFFTHRGNLRLQQDRHDRERLQRLEDRQVVLYVDLAEYVHDLEARLPALTDELGIVDMPQVQGDLINGLRLDARVRILAPDALRQAWTEFRKAEEDMHWQGNEEPDGHDPRGGAYMEWDGPAVTRVRTSLISVQETLRRVMLAESTTKLPARVNEKQANAV